MRPVDPSVEAHLDSVFEKGALDIESRMAGKQYKYKLSSIIDFTVRGDMNGRTGKCEVTKVRYDKTEDCNFYTIKDVDTGEVMRISQFEIEFEEIK